MLWPGLGALVGFGFGIGKFPLKIPKFSIFCPSGQKKISSVWVKKNPGQSWVGLTFTAGSKYARVGSGPIFSVRCLLTLPRSVLLNRLMELNVSLNYIFVQRLDYIFSSSFIFTSFRWWEITFLFLLQLHFILKNYFGSAIKPDYKIINHDFTIL